jgi:hypothetical protein
MIILNSTTDHTHIPEIDHFVKKSLRFLHGKNVAVAPICWKIKEEAKTFDKKYLTDSLLSPNADQKWMDF